MIPNSLRGKRYHVMSLKNPEYFMLMMKTYGTLDDLEGSDTNQRYKGRAGMWWTNYLMIMRSLVTKFHYCHQVDSNRNCCNYPIYMEKTWKIIGLNVAMLTSWHLHRSMQINCGSNWLVGHTSSLSWIFGVSWDGRWQITPCIKKESLMGSREDGFEQGGGSQRTTSLWQRQTSRKMDCGGEKMVEGQANISESVLHQTKQWL